ncbi:DeoR/GlpR transcriptional regulator [Gluconacetobacter tumulisoli]|uniref:DeoR/GlpR transcriptional regulator n=1 Tax=Gluconacetobacter tumulisoli TaxID=1286189 RepID=A0A7W4PLS1_9PROT|nr:DeoR/GlpR transcriptional regulator [Gluconacetobacter tumulisoli]
MLPDRLTQIRHHLYRHGTTGIHDLARVVNASLATIRRDLQRLEEQGVVVRTHGGAAIAESAGFEAGFATRENRGLEAKRAIADAAFAGLRPGSTVFLDAGTTVLQLARRLRLTPMKLTIFSNSIAIADTLTGVEDIQLVLLGGRLRHENRCVVGPLARQAIEGLWFDRLYLGASAIQPDGAIATPDSDEAALNAAMLARSGERILLADSSKFGCHSTYRVGTLDQIGQVHTDTGLSADWTQRLRQMNLALHLVAAAASRPAEENRR